MLLEELAVLRSLILNLFPAALPGFPVETVRRVLAHAEDTKHVTVLSRLEVPSQ